MSRLTTELDIVFFSPAKHTVICLILSHMTTRLFREKSMNSMLREFSPLWSAFRNEAKCIMQIFKPSKTCLLFDFITSESQGLRNV